MFLFHLLFLAQNQNQSPNGPVSDGSKTQQQMEQKRKDVMPDFESLNPNPPQNIPVHHEPKGKIQPRQSQQVKQNGFQSKPHDGIPDSFMFDEKQSPEQDFGDEQIKIPDKNYRNQQNQNFRKQIHNKNDNPWEQFDPDKLGKQNQGTNRQNQFNRPGSQFNDDFGDSRMPKEFTFGHDHDQQGPNQNFENNQKINPDPFGSGTNRKPEDFDKFERKTKKDKELSPYNKRQNPDYFNENSDFDDQEEQDTNQQEQDINQQEQQVIEDGHLEFFDDDKIDEKLDIQTPQPTKHLRKVKRRRRIQVKSEKTQQNKTKEEDEDIDDDKTEATQNDNKPYEPKISKFKPKKNTQKELGQFSNIPRILHADVYTLGFIRQKPINITYFSIPTDTNKAYCRINEAVVQAQVNPSTSSLECRLSLPLFITSAYVAISFDGVHYSSPVSVGSDVPMWLLIIPICFVAFVIYLFIKAPTKKKKILGGMNLDSFRPMHNIPKKDETFGAEIDQENLEKLQREKEEEEQENADYQPMAMPKVPN